MAGRPTKYDKQLAAKICTLLGSGCTRRAAVGCCGITDQTFANWIKRNPEFAQKVQEAEALVLVRMANAVVKAAETDWRAGLEYLKRRDRENWGDSLNLTKLPDDDLIAEAEIILKRTGEGGPS